MNDNPKLNYRQKFYEKNGVIFFEGEFGDCMYDIQKGSVGVFIDYNGNRQQLLATLGPGDYFGEMAIIEATRRTATIVALEDETMVRLIDADDFPDYAKENPEKVAKMVLSMGKRLKISNTNLAEANGIVCEVLESTYAMKPLSKKLIKKCEALTDYTKKKNEKKKTE